MQPELRCLTRRARGCVLGRGLTARTRLLLPAARSAAAWGQAGAHDRCVHACSQMLGPCARAGPEAATRAAAAPRPAAAVQALPKHGHRCRTANGGRAAGRRAVALDYNRTTPAHGQPHRTTTRAWALPPLDVVAPPRWLVLPAARPALRRNEKRSLLLGALALLLVLLQHFWPVIAVIARYYASYYSYYSEVGLL